MAVPTQKAYADCAGTLFQPTRLRALQKKPLSARCPEHGYEWKTLPRRKVRKAATGGLPYCGWTESCTTLKPWLKPLFVDIYRGIIIPGFLGWCKMDPFTVSQNGQQRHLEKRWWKEHRAAFYRDMSGLKRYEASVHFHTVDGRNPAPPKKPGNDYSLVNTNKQWLPMASIWCRSLSIHSMHHQKHMKLWHEPTLLIY